MQATQPGPTIKLQANGEFSLNAALKWVNCFPSTLSTQDFNSYREAHVIGDKPVLVLLQQAPKDQSLQLQVYAGRLDEADLQSAKALIERKFSLELDGERFQRDLTKQDPVVNQLHSIYRGLRPVLFSSSFEALCWAIAGHRIRMSQAAIYQKRLQLEFGRSINYQGRQYQAFPSPKDLVKAGDERISKRTSLNLEKCQRIVALAQRFIAGELDDSYLRNSSLDRARKTLEESPGIGAWSSEFCLIRAIGRTDLIPLKEARLLQAITMAYGVDETEARSTQERLAKKWGNLQTWVSFLLRVALHDGIDLTQLSEKPINH